MRSNTASRTREASVAIVDPQSLPNLAPVRDRLPGLAHVIGVAGAREAWRHVVGDAAGDRRAPISTPVATRANDPALIIYTSGTTGPPKGALMPHSLPASATCPGFAHSHDVFPQPGDLFWSPADWAWTGGLMDALLPTLYFGLPILGYRGRFDAERAFHLLEKYGIRNSFLFPTALKLMMKAVPAPARDASTVDLRSIMSAGESVGVTVFEWARERSASRSTRCSARPRSTTSSATARRPGR